ncbi:hypothetical protein P879_05523 [Paragonimus westermani]|uniref:Uncharacterized protein n=1 Tax=Paragonimus westermani TaxID=34504 RepID=A0A8T0DHJ1_9TREM|nr:hypothetical protein P879_05523 [Paragonimus westermani]
MGGGPKVAAYHSNGGFSSTETTVFFLQLDPLWGNRLAYTSVISKILNLRAHIANQNAIGVRLACPVRRTGGIETRLDCVYTVNPLQLPTVERTSSAKINGVSGPHSYGAALWLRHGCSFSMCGRSRYYWCQMSKCAGGKCLCGDDARKPQKVLVIQTWVECEQSG